METIRSKTGARQQKKEFARTHAPQLELAFLLQDWEDAPEADRCNRAYATRGYGRFSRRNLK